MSQLLFPDRDLASSPRVRLAAVALVAGVLLLTAASVRAIQLDLPDTITPASSVVDDETALFARAVQIDPEEVVQSNIFAIDRMAPPERYPMPGEFRDEGAPVVAAAPPARPSVLGTAVGIDGAAFATAQLPGTPPRIVRVGDRLGVFTVVAITRGTVTFRAADAAPFEVNAP